MDKEMNVLEEYCSDNELNEYRERKKKTLSIYRDHYNKANNKISAVNELIGIKNEIARQNQHTEEVLREEIEFFGNIINLKRDEDWLPDLDRIVFKKALNGIRIVKDHQDYIIKRAESLGHAKFTIERIKNTLKGCFVLAGGRLREENIENLLIYVTNNDYPPSIPELWTWCYPGNKIIGVSFGEFDSVVKNLFSELAQHRPGARAKPQESESKLELSEKNTHEKRAARLAKKISSRPLTEYQKGEGHKEWSEATIYSFMIACKHDESIDENRERAIMSTSDKKIIMELNNVPERTLYNWRGMIKVEEAE